MSEAEVGDAWWSHVGAGKTVPVGVLVVDCELPEIVQPDDASAHLRARYFAGIEYVGRELRAAEPLHWRGNRAVLVVGDRDVAAIAKRTFIGAEHLWQRTFVDLDVPARIVMHVGQATRAHGSEKFSGDVFSEAYSLLNVAVPRAVTVSATAALLLPARDRGRLSVVSTPGKSGEPMFVFPGAARSGSDSEPVEARLWNALLAYSESPEIRRLRYVGFRLQRKEPPSLDIKDVFVEPRLAVLSMSDSSEPGPRGKEPPMDGSRQHRARESSRSLGEVLRSARHVVVLGDPGAGKSTLLRWLAVAAAEGALSGVIERMEPVLPLPLSVGRLAEILRGDLEAAPRDILAAYYADRGVAPAAALSPFLEDCLKHGRCLVLLDGLDEVQPHERSDVQRWLETFISDFRSNRFLATSRIIGYSGLRLPEDGALVEVEPFDAAQIERYAGAFHRAYLAWEHGSLSPAQADEQTAGFLEALRTHPRLASLASNPFMLSALALVHRAEGRLPRHRIQAYQVLARTLCETWDTTRRLVLGDSRTTPIAYEEEAIPILGDLALEMHNRYPNGVAPEAFVQDALARSHVRRRGMAMDEARALATRFLRQAAEEAPLLLERGPGQWGFLHLTFQELFVALGLHADERFGEVVLEHALEPRWEEILRLGLSHMAIVQNRPLAATKLMQRLADWKAPRGAEWLSEVLQKQLPLAISLAGELGTSLPPDTSARLVEKVSRYIARARVPDDLCAMSCSCCWTSEDSTKARSKRRASA